MNRQPYRTATAAPAPIAVLLTLVLALVLALVPGIGAAQAAPDSGVEARFVQLINAERAKAGLPALRVADDLVGVGRRHAVRMAEQDHLHHNPNLGSDVKGWDKVGENVGRGPDVDRVHAAFMASEGHRRNILDPEWTEVGVGVEMVDGGLWVTELFRLPSGASAPPPAADPAPADPAPDPAPTSTPEPASDATTSAAAPAAEPDPEPEPPVREVVDVPLPVDRVTLVLARLGVHDDGHPPAGSEAP
ncbi:CAP domain-containing protein [Nitriliruptor alkaliphilus]|uniref:CAP domain-containing protein n=1 Tax=Nitriliruptor alkaliphilus TaxID=427918 RepID=UPI00147068E5|nr:CAP domain-containing protein [Nitriliruptor alkaliphilus]